MHPSILVVTFFLFICLSSQHEALSTYATNTNPSYLSPLSLSLCVISPIVIRSVCLSVCLFVLLYSLLPSSPLTPPQPHRLSVFLQFRNQPVALLDHVCVLLVLVVRPIGLDDLVDAVDGAGYAVCGDELRQVPEEKEMMGLVFSNYG